jgi:hypothetical protein
LLSSPKKVNHGEHGEHGEKPKLSRNEFYRSVKRILFFAVPSVVKETLVYSSPRRKPGSSASVFLDSGFRRNDEYEIFQRDFASASRRARRVRRG